MKLELSYDQLRRSCDPQSLGCTSSLEVPRLETIIGQDRALRALSFGLAIPDRGFNIFVAGRPGTGRTRAVKGFLEVLAKSRPTPPDYCYVYNFVESSRPNALRLPPGRSREFRADMKNLVERVTSEFRRAFESEEYIAQRDATLKGFEGQKEDLLRGANEQALRKGFSLQATPAGLLTIALREGRPLREEEFNALSPQERTDLDQRREEVQAEIQVAVRKARRLDASAQEAVQALDQKVALYSLNHLMEDVKQKNKDLPEVLGHLEAVQQDILQNLSQFRETPQDQAAQLFRPPDRRDFPGRRYEVNVVVDNGQQEGAPVIIEPNPIYGNLFGRVEQEVQFGALMTDLTLIRGGVLHRANGGYLVMPVEALLQNPFSWEALKRALANHELSIEDVTERYGFMSTRGLRPEAIPLDVKLVLIGQGEVYNLLRAYDEEFAELFKVKADFDNQMDRNRSTECDYVGFVRTLCDNAKLKHFDAPALARIVEHGSRLAEDQQKLSTRFRDIADVIREASHYAGQENAELVGAGHVKKAIDERYYRSNLVQERVNEMITRGAIMIDASGQEVGQVNGLSVISLGDISFGQPSRITATVGLGQAGVVDIEREAKLGGPIHTKGVMILAGYLTERFAQDKPLSLSAHLVFEQSYSGVEGDSASSTELYAILSRLSGLPIHQGLAVTGSVNQKGEIQAIGGVNEKIEGFFEICKAKGLTGKQGVLIPTSNVPNLMLKEEVIQAAREGKFHIWPVSTVEEGIELLTGTKGGQRLEDGSYEAGTVFGLADQQLRKLAQTMRDFAGSPDKRKKAAHG